ncbi:DNA internalization-related competence protein ComEC/Rec2 [Vibrio mytili]|uniref:DNA internalization-related competence protein ComEC/Rec2 n=1 Tax=Vibrio mytili TaxID=50718 RepID=UPI002F42B623
MTLSEKSWTLVLFVTTVISSAWWLAIPDEHWLPLGVVAIGLIIKLRRGLISIGAISGFLVIVVHGNVTDHQRQALFQAEENITITGKVNSSFKQISHGFEGIVTVNQVNSQKLLPFLKPKVRFISPFILPVNSEFTTTATIKPIIGLRNEAGFDAEKQSMGRGIIARATAADDAHWTIRSAYSLRQAIISKVTEQIRHLSLFPLISALAFSERDWLSDEHWRALRDSGLLHLISISGLHIGMAFGIGTMVGSAIRYVIPRYHFLPSMSGLVAAVAYAWLADFSLPTIRAVSVCMLYVLLKFSLVHWSPWRVVLLAVSLHLLFEPFASYSMSFWLSYLSVGAVLFAINAVQRTASTKLAKLRVLLLSQLLLSLFIIPVSGYFFSGFSWSSLVYNMVFIPWFGFVVVPVMFAAVFAALLVPSFAIYLWELLDAALWPLNHSIQYAVGTWLPLSKKMALFVVFISISVLVKRFMPYRAWLVVSAVVLSLHLLPQRSQSTWQIDVLDVGHGLAVMVEKEGKILLYDTGKSWQGGSIADQVITPVLHSRGIKRIDTFVLSHSDNDHAGGRFVVEDNFAPTHKRSSQNFFGYQPCNSQEAWQWQGLRLNVIWPPKQVERAYNPHSCVFKLEDPISGFTMLFTGDIEAISEWILLREPDKLRSDIMLVPHHGSRSSSNPKFIQAVSPSLAIASLAKNNQWGMPAPSVVAAYKENGSTWLDTGEKGQVSIRVDKENWVLKTKRSNTFEPWYRQMLRKGVE